MLKQSFKIFIVFSLTVLSRAVLRRYAPRIVVVAGSVGKTSTKDAIYSVLNAALSVRKSEKSYNSELGVPLTILGLENAWNNPFRWLWNLWQALDIVLFRSPYPRYLVLEVGADRPGDIRRITAWLKPDVAVLTRFGEVPVHIEFFRDRDELIAEDAEVARALRPGGLLIVNHDDRDALSLRDKFRARAVTYGFDPSATVVASNVHVTYDERGYPTGVACKVNIGGNVLPLRIAGVVGRAQVYAALPALLIGHEFGINLVSGTSILENHRTPPGRLRLIPAEKGATVIDDTYNASPVAAEEALSALNEIEAKGRKIAVLADMMELGRDSAGEHRRIGALAGKAADVVVAVGIRARRIAEGALTAGLTERNIFQFDESAEAAKFTENLMGKGDVILVKGSQSMRMERVVEELMAEPDRKEELLVRQDKEWKRR